LVYAAHCRITGNTYSLVDKESLAVIHKVYEYVKQQPTAARAGVVAYAGKIDP